MMKHVREMTPEERAAALAELTEGAIVTDPEQIELLTARDAPVERIEVPPFKGARR